jgi:LacI family transcriptional regulator
MDTIKDVARLAGVSPATVSRVLNRPELVSPDARERVRAAMEQLNYRPNLVAKGLKTRVTGNVGVILNDMLHFDLASLADALSRQKLNLILCDSEDNWGMEAEHIEDLIRRRVDALMIAPVGIRHDRIAQLPADGIPTLLLCQDVGGLEFPRVSYDVFRGAHRATTALADKGHARIAFLASTTANTIRQELFDGFRQGLADRGVPLVPSLVRTNSPSPLGGLKAMGQILTLDTPPTAVFVAHPLMAQGAMRALWAAGLRCPDDISVVVFGDSQWARANHPPLTVVEPDAVRMGEQAVTNLISLINHSLPPPLWDTRVPSSFVERQSVRRLA